MIIGARAIAGTPTAGGGPPMISAGSSKSSKLAAIHASAIHSSSGSISLPSPIPTSTWSHRREHILDEHPLVAVAPAPLVRRPDRLPVTVRHVCAVQGLLQRFHLPVVGPVHERVEDLRKPRI